ncbi:ATP-dependent Clp protease ATP-binding subunit [bacterium]|jgi:ATP-dependent Clp protease ATP-binding subunit ClpC|nr:ATP-dependent Clp protease ATP-binding subunit [bacterium]
MEDNYFEKFTKEAKDALVIAQEKAEESNLNYVGTEHILLGILHQENSLGATILNNFGVSISNVELVLRSVGRSSKTQNDSSKPAGLSGFAKQVIEQAVGCASRYNHNFVGTEHLLFSVVSQDNTAATVILENMKINPKHVQAQIVEFFQKGLDNKGMNGQMNNMNPVEFFLNGLNGVLASSDQTSFKKGDKKSKSKTPTLDYFTVDLCDQVRKGKVDPIIGRDKEIERLVSILNRKTKNNPVLIGEPGVGKTAIVEGLAMRIVDNKVPQQMLDKRILILPMGSVVAGTKFRGEFEERIKLIIEEASSMPNIILFIDELHTLIGAGSAEGSLDAANILKPALSRSKIQVIGATTTNEYRKAIESDQALERRFQTIMVNEPSIEHAIEMLNGIRESFEDHHNLMITDEAIESAVKLSSRYITERFLPDKAIDLIDEACALKRVTTPEHKSEIKELQAKLSKLTKKKEQAVSAQDYDKAKKIRDQELKLTSEIDKLKTVKTPRDLRKKITSDDVATMVHKITGVPVSKLVSSDLSKLKNLESILHKHIIGQEHAVKDISKAIRRSRAGISSSKRPIGSFLFLGPTGVGKTELVKTLASEVYNDPKALIKIDMSEFSEKHSASRLTGTTAGYVGYEEGGQLTESVRRKPYSVILFDEVEKAHPEFFNLLLQILEDGILTDGKGKKVDFTNTIIVMTSNLGASKLTSKAGPIGFNLSDTEEKERIKDFESTKEEIMSDVRKFFKPEFINRIDKVIVFDPLKHEDVKQIIKLLITQLQFRMNDRNIKIKISEKAISYLAEKGYDPEYGARPARRILQDKIEDEITELILDQKVSTGQTISVGYKTNKLTFSIK